MGPNSKKSKKIRKKKKKLGGVHFVTKMLIKCSITSKKSYFHSKKSKKSKKNVCFFHILCKKHTVFNHFWFRAPYPIYKKDLNKKWRVLKFFKISNICHLVDEYILCQISARNLALWAHSLFVPVFLAHFYICYFLSYTSYIMSYICLRQ